MSKHNEYPSVFYLRVYTPTRELSVGLTTLPAAIMREKEDHHRLNYCDGCGT